jgi:hypothetical protein
MSLTIDGSESNGHQPHQGQEPRCPRGVGGWLLLVLSSDRLRAALCGGVPVVQVALCVFSAVMKNMQRTQSFV